MSKLRVFIARKIAQQGLDMIAGAAEIVGLGRIGREMAKRARGFKLIILADQEASN